VRIRVISTGTTEFEPDPEYAGPAIIREAIEDGCNDVASTIVDWTDTERSNISHDDYVTVTGDDGTQVWEGWLGGDLGPAPVDRDALDRLAATWESQASSIRNAHECDPVEMVRDCARQLRAAIGGH
jgi:hypothetical protein